MPSKPKLETLLNKHLGKESGGVLLKKVDKMVKQGATPAKIEKAISAHLAAHMRTEITSTISKCVLEVLPPDIMSLVERKITSSIGLIHNVRPTIVQLHSEASKKGQK